MVVGKGHWTAIGAFMFLRVVKARAPGPATLVLDVDVTPSFAKSGVTKQAKPFTHRVGPRSPRDGRFSSSSKVRQNQPQ